MRELGKDPLTWSFTKLFGLHVRCDLHEFEGLPGSHAWQWKATRLLTKAQCVGVVVSIMARTDRVEFLVDDGTSLVKAVLWGEGIESHVVLGNLVHVEGKLNVDNKWDALEPTRELRILRMSKVEDPNEELLHWTQVMELIQIYYSAGESDDALVQADGGAQIGIQWEDIATEVFFSLNIDPSRRQQFLGRSDSHVHDGILLETLESFLRKQKESTTDEVIGITFSDHIATVERDTNGQDGTTTKNQRIRALQYAFRKLRQAGLLFLEDDMTDRHILLSFEAVLKPALLQLFRGHAHGRSTADIADAILTQERFKCIPLHWIKTGVEHLLISQLVVQREESQLFVIK